MSSRVGPGMRMIGETPEPVVAVTMSCMSESSILPYICQHIFPSGKERGRTMFAIDHNGLYGAVSYYLGKMI
jgi:hypothetical protein